MEPIKDPLLLSTSSDVTHLTPKNIEPNKKTELLVDVNKNIAGKMNHFQAHWPVWLMFVLLLVTDIVLLFLQNSVAAIFVLVCGVTLSQGAIDFYRDMKYKPVWSLLLRILALAGAGLILWQRGWQ